MVVGIIPAFSLKKAMKAGRKKDGHLGCARRRIEILQLSYGKLLEAWNQKTRDVKKLQWADGLWRLCKMVIAAFLGDQPELDSVCCDSAQSCKQCQCPRDNFHLPGRFLKKQAVLVMSKVTRQARNIGVLVGRAWNATAVCGQAAYKTARQAAGGVHLMRNSFWNILGFDVQQQAFKDPMHGMDHGVAITILDGVVRRLHDLERELGLERNFLVRKLTARLYHLCDSQDRRHLTLFNFVNQSIMDQFEVLGQKGSGKKNGDKAAPRIVDASDMQALLVCLPYLMDGLADYKIDDHSTNGGEQAHDPIPEMIIVINDYLHLYHLYRQPVNTTDDTLQMGVMADALLEELVRIFPYTSRIGRSDKTRSMWCCEKPHSMTHFGDNVEQVGHSKNISTQVTESTHKPVKAKGHLTNKKADKVGFSMMQAVVRDSAAAAMSADQDLRGEVWTVRRRDGSEVKLRASRAWDNISNRGLSGCMADSFRCNIWRRASDISGITHRLEGCGRDRQGGMGYCILQLNDLLPQQSRYTIIFT